MSTRNTIKIKTPFGGHEVEIYEWITGEDRDYIEAPYSRIDVQPQFMGKHSKLDVTKLEIDKMIKEADNRELEKFIVSVDGKTEITEGEKTLKPWEAVLQMHEKDTKFVRAKIEEIAKKNEEESTG